MKKAILRGAFICLGATVLVLTYQSGDNKIPKQYESMIQKAEKHGELTYEEIKKLPKKDRPDLAALQHYEMTRDPKLGYPPVERKVLAFEKLVTKSKSARTALDQVQWDERGPNNVGGRTRALMFDPNDLSNKKVWAGGISGGLWVNEDITDNNIGWTNYDDFMASLSVATLTYDPNSTTTFYLGTGERFTNDFEALGIWKTTDGGTVWNRLSNTSDFSYVPKMLVTDNSTIIAATASGIKRSVDGGDNWTSPSVVDTDMADVEIAANGDLYAGDFSGNIHKSVDDGVTWVTLSGTPSGGSRVEIGTSAASSNVIYAITSDGSSMIEWFAKSIDAGENWTELSIPMYREQGGCAESTANDFTRGQSWYDLIIGVHPTDESIVVIGGIDLYRSIDEGSNWELVSYWTGECDVLVHADQHAIIFRPENPNEAIFGNDGGVYYSPDIGDADDPSFTARNNDYNVTQFYASATVNEPLSNEFLAGAQDNGTQRFLSAGMNSTTEATGGDGGFCHIDQDDPNYQVTSFVYSTYNISTNRGVSFSRLYDDADNVGRFINPTDYDSDADVLYGAGGVNQLTRIRDITTTPTTLEIIDLDLSSRQITTIKHSPYTDNTIYIGVRISDGEGLLFRIDNANETTPIVTEISGSFDATRGGWVSSIDVGASDDQLLATFSNYGVQSIFESTDGGINWFNKEGDLDDFPVYSGLYNPYDRSQVIIATELGVWSTDDISASDPIWSATNMGLANVSTRMIKFRASDGLLLAATHGRGLYTSYSFSPDIYAGISVPNKISYAGQLLNFTNTSIGSADNFLWDFGDGYTSSDINTSHAYAAPGNYIVTLEMNNGQSNAQVEVTILPTRQIPYLAENGGNFDSNTSDFYAENLSGTPFQLGNSSVSGKEGTSSGDNAWVTGLEDDQYSDDALAYLYSPGYDFSSSGTYILSFDVNYSFEANWDGFIVEYTYDNGENWTKLGDAVETDWYNQTSEANAIWGDGVPIFSGVTTGFETKRKDVSFLADNARVGFRIYFGTDANTTDIGMAIDDFEVNGPTSTPVPNFNSSNPEICEGSTVTFNDESSGTITSYAWNFGAGATPETATGSGPIEVSYTSAGLYTVALTTTGDSGDVMETKVDYVRVEASAPVDNAIEVNLSDFTTCDEEDIIITVINSVTGVKYQVFNADTDASIGSYEFGDGNDLAVNIGTLSETTNTYIRATQPNSCVSTITNTPTFTSIGPNAKMVSNDYNSDAGVCEGNSVTFIIENSDVGVTYSIENTTDNSVLSTLAGDGNDISIATGSMTEGVTIILKGNLDNTTCSINLTNELEIIVNALPDATISQDGTILSLPFGASSYQWYLEGEIINGATNLTYNALSKGNYTCEVTSDGCSVLSEVFTSTITGLDDLNYADNIYPNPTSNGIVNVRAPVNSTLTVYNALGGVVFQSLNRKVTSLIDLSFSPSGMYVLEIKSGEEIKKERIIISK